MCLKACLKLVSILKKLVAPQMEVRKIAASFQLMGVQGFGENILEVDHLLHLLCLFSDYWTSPAAVEPGRQTACNSPAADEDT